LRGHADLICFIESNKWRSAVLRLVVAWRGGVWCGLAGALRRLSTSPDRRMMNDRPTDRAPRRYIAARSNEADRTNEQPPHCIAWSAAYMYSLPAVPRASALRLVISS